MRGAEAPPLRCLEKAYGDDCVIRRGLQLHICLNSAVGVFLIRVFG